MRLGYGRAPVARKEMCHAQPLALALPAGVNNKLETAHVLNYSYKILLDMLKK